MEVAHGPGELGTILGRDLRTSEKIEADINALIERRHDQRVESEGERDAEATWRESERAHAAARRDANRQAWIEHYEGQADRLEATLGALVEEKRREAAKLRRDAA